MTPQDYILFHLIAALGSDFIREKTSLNLTISYSSTLLMPNFPELPSVNTESFRILLRTLVGGGDFARTNAHYIRRPTHPQLHDSTWGRSCLHCFFHHNVDHQDPE